MKMAMISPSRREVSPAEQLCRSPRLLPPRGGRVSSRNVAYFLTEDLIQQKMATGGPTGGPRGRARARHPRGQVGPPCRTSSALYFLLFPKITSVEFQDFWSCAEQVSNICSFSSQEFQLSAFSCKPCKIREKRHKYCNIMCNNSP